MKCFSDWSLKTKLTTVLIATSGAVLLVTCLAFVLYEKATFQDDFAKGLAMNAEIVGQRIAISLEFNRPSEVETALEAFKAEKQIEAACVYDAAGSLFAKYPKNLPNDTFPKQVKEQDIEFSGDDLLLFQPVKNEANGEVAGTIFIRCGLEKARARMREHILMALVIMVVATLIAVVLAAWFQRLISRPILALADTAEAVSTEKNYALRAPRGADDEVGRLIQSFNEMLSQIQQRDRELLAARATAESAREEAEKANLLKSKFLSVMSHELRTPLSIIIDFIKLVLPEVEEEKRTIWADWLGRSLGQAHHMLNQINDILDISRIEAGKMEVSFAECEILQIVEGGPMGGIPYLMKRNNNRFICRREFKRGFLCEFKRGRISE